MPLIPIIVAGIIIGYYAGRKIGGLYSYIKTNGLNFGYKKVWGFQS
jgi:hypothetical protein